MCTCCIPGALELSRQSEHDLSKNVNFSENVSKKPVLEGSFSHISVRLTPLTTNHIPFEIDRRRPSFAFSKSHRSKISCTTW